MTAVDTNVLIYAHDPRDPAKQETALSLLGSLADGVLLWQVACEFLAASRKLASFGYAQAQAWREVHQLRRAWTSILPSWAILNRAEQLQGSHSLSLWDSLIVAACLEGGVTLLYSEDFDAYSRIESLNVSNPFKAP